MKTSDVIRELRPYQRNVARLIIEDVVRGAMPTSISEAVARYSNRIGEPVHFDTGTGWSGDIREAAIWTLLTNGFARGNAVRIAKDGGLSLWINDRLELEAAAAIEIEFGGNRALSVRAKDIVGKAAHIGTGPRAVYVYTDSRLDSLGDKCTKIGRHDRSGGGEVLQRVLMQYSTGNPGFPVLRAIAKTDDDVALETALHRKFDPHRITGGFGAEWFAVAFEDVIGAIHEHLASQ